MLDVLPALPAELSVKVQLMMVDFPPEMATAPPLPLAIVSSGYVYVHDHRDDLTASIFWISKQWWRPNYPNYDNEKQTNLCSPRRLSARSAHWIQPLHLPQPLEKGWGLIEIPCVTGIHLEISGGIMTIPLACCVVHKYTFRDEQEAIPSSNGSPRLTSGMIAVQHTVRDDQDWRAAHHDGPSIF